ncbi:MAG: inositol monophosphatase family protein [Aestuariivirga sp.]
MAASPAMTVMIAAVRKAARGVQRDFGELANLQVSLKGPADYVTAADKRCDKILREELTRARPGYSFLTEETGVIKGIDPDHRFIIDPIDGTTNFMHSLAVFAISVALERKGEIVTAVTYNPITDELFTAEKGQGAFFNNKRLRVANRADIQAALIAYEVPHRGSKDLGLSRAEIGILQEKVVGIRGFGSAALALCYLAAGRIDAFICRGLQAWDIAAGVLIVREAGGFLTDCDGDENPMATGNVLATNGTLLPLFKAALKDARSA